jgi:WD40 repeat protein/serine/threonine protein kinase
LSGLSPITNSNRPLPDLQDVRSGRQAIVSGDQAVWQLLFGSVKSVWSENDNNSTMPENTPCPECGAELPTNAPHGLCPRCLAGMGLSLLPTEAVPKSDIVIERTGAMIGRYKLLEKIGEGGFGVVFMAEQVEPVQRKVALKIIKAGMDTKEVIARFEAERQAIALMDHPNIARALDAGTTEAGRPYFVMELVRGIPITDYCDQKQLATRERLQLFIKVCQAVQHAHQKGVIHRDLKPSNVLVTEHDGEPVPKVIDFGVAKALGQKLTAKTLFTAFHHMIGTPAYMSPEQAALSGLDIDTRADIYSLGVLLYELLTGVTPFDTEVFRTAALDEIRRMIRETEPPKPSTRLQTLGAKLTEVAKCRHTDPAALSRLVRGDLDWIVMRCLEKDRKRRYETANGLAADVARHLSSEPIVARPTNNLYRLQKLVLRNKLLFTASGAVTAVLLIGLAVSTWSLVQEKKALRHVERERQRADRHATSEAHERRRAEQLRGVAEAALYQARLNENRALRLARPQGWSDLVYHNLSSNAAMNLPERDVIELRTEAAACMESVDVRETDRFSGHAMEVWSLDFSPDSALLASADYGGVSVIWQVASKKVLVLREIKDPAAGSVRRYTSSAPFPAVRFNPRGGEVAYCTWRRSVEVLGLTNQSPTLRLSSQAHAKQLDYDRGGKVIAVAWAGDRVVAYEAGSGKVIREIQGYNGTVAVSPDGNAVATIGNENAILIYSLSGEGPPLVLGRHPNVKRLTFSPRGDLLSSASEDHTAKIFDVKAAKELFTLLGHKARIHAAEFSQDGRFVVTVSDDQTARIWDAHTGEAALTIRPTTGKPILAAAFSPDGRHLALASGNIILYDLVNEPAKQLLFGHGYYVNSLAFHPGRPLLSSASGDKSVRLWNLDSGETERVLPGHPAGRPDGLAFSSNGELLAVGHGSFSNYGPSDRGIRTWETASGKLHRTFQGHQRNTPCVAFDPAGMLLASGDTQGLVIVNAVANGNEQCRWSQSGDPIVALQFVSPGHWLFMAHASGQLRLGDCISGEIVAQAKTAGRPTGIAVSRRRNYAAVATDCSAIEMFAVPTLSLTTTIQTHTARACALTVSPDGHWLASGGEYGHVTLWDALTGVKLLELPPQESPIRCLAFEPTGSRLAFAGEEEQITVWQLGMVRTRLKSLGIDWSDSTANPPDPDEDHRWPLKLADDVLNSDHPLATNGLALVRWATLLLQLPKAEPEALAKAAKMSVKAIEQAPDEFEVWLKVVGLLEDLGEYPEAAALLNQAMERHQKDPRYWSAKGISLEKRARLEPACDAFARAIALTSTNTGALEPALKEALLHRAGLLRQLGRDAEAALDFCRAVNIPLRDPGTKPNLIDL